MSDVFDGPPPLLATARFLLRRLEFEDVASVYRYASDPEVARYTLWPPHPSIDFTRGFVKALSAPAILSWAITDKTSRQLDGIVLFHSLNRLHQRVELAFSVARDRWNKGTATEAAEAAVRFAINQLALNRIEATVMPGNLGSRRVLEKLGFHHEGRMRRSHRRYDGFHDMDLFSLLREDAAFL